ncbi:hypothetical protein PM082_023468 [Marasmius tenuissimus]|nr:hypothetical protein PM082_023468 [Marasmius tenuissimus]
MQEVSACKAKQLQYEQVRIHSHHKPTSDGLCGPTSLSLKKDAKKLVNSLKMGPCILSTTPRVAGSETVGSPCRPSLKNEAFFSQNLHSDFIEQYGTFPFSDSKKPDELEVPKGMVALTAATVYACLQDHATIRRR